MKFNINHKVKVKLNEFGISILRANHMKDTIWMLPKSRPEFKPPEQDAEGYATFQLWHLMHSFGSYLSNGVPVPFETDIEIVEDKGNDSNQS